MQEEIYLEAILNDFQVENKQYIIYGTGKIADIFYDKIVQETSKDNILGFINEKLDIKEYKGKPVMKCREIPMSYIEDTQVLFVVATVSKIPLFIRKLNERGIDNERIFKSTTVFSCDCFEEDLRPIKRIVLYPPITDEDTLKEKIQEFSDLFGSNIYVVYLVNDALSLKDCNKFNLLMNISNYSAQETDLIWVWRADCVRDVFVKESDYAICCDDDFLYHSVERMHMILNNKIYGENYQELSKKNYTRMMKELSDFEYASVCGMGPSLLKMSERNANIVKKGCIIVCNNFYDVECNWYPHVYVLQDNGYLSEELRDVTNKIVEYVVEHHVYLFVDSQWFNTFIHRYPILFDLLIGIKKKEELCFPILNELYYFSQDNVVPAMSIPIALGLKDTVYIIGCDGGNNSGAWEHANGEAIENDAFKDKRFMMLNSISSCKEYTEYVNSLFGKIINFGETKGKHCHSLVKGAYSHLNERLY